MKITIILSGNFPASLIEVREEIKTSPRATKRSTTSLNKKDKGSIKAIKIVKKKTKKPLTKKK